MDKDAAVAMGNHEPEPIGFVDALNSNLVSPSEISGPEAVSFAGLFLVRGCQDPNRGLRCPGVLRPSGTRPAGQA